jgi:hypothetical protein
MANYIRKYELSITTYVPSSATINSGDIRDTGLIESFSRETGRAVVLTEHQMTAEIDYVKKGSKNPPALIKINNISKNTLQQIKQNDRLVLKAGYEGEDLPTVFIGDIISVVTSRTSSGEEAVTTLICGDSQNIITNLRLAGGVPPRTSYKRVITDILEVLGDNGLPTGEFYTGLPDPRPVLYRPYVLSNTILNARRPQDADFINIAPVDKNLPNGRVYEGNALEELNKILKEINYVYYIHAGKIYVQPSGSMYGHIRKKTFVTLNNSLLKHPVEPLKSTAGMSIQEGEKKGVRVVTFLNASIKPSKKVDLDVPNDYKGSYEIKKISHSLSYEGVKWDTVLELMRSD